MTKQSVDYSVRLRRLEHERYQLEDQVKSIDKQIQKLNTKHLERIGLLISKQSVKKLLIRECHEQAGTLRRRIAQIKDEKS